jgi:Rod binding domain-containing protein
MSSIQTAIMSRPLPLSDAFKSSQSKSFVSANDPQKAAKDFESVFTSMILKEMRQTLEPNDVFGGLFDQFMGQHLAESGGIGLAKMVHGALEKMTPSSKGPEKAATPEQSAVTKS